MDSNFLLLFMFLLFNSSDKSNNQLHILTDYIKNIKIEPLYTEEKIRLVKKIIPLLPEDYSNPVQKSIILSEKLVRIMEIKEVMSEVTKLDEIQTIPVANNKERMSKIISIVQKDFPNPKLKNMGFIMDLIVNMDKYKNILGAMGGLMNNMEGSKDGNNIMKIMEAFVDDKDKKNMDSIKEMARMMEFMKVLDSPKREKPIEG